MEPLANRALTQSQYQDLGSIGRAVLRLILAPCGLFTLSGTPALLLVAGIFKEIMTSFAFLIKLGVFGHFVTYSSAS